MAAAAAAVDRTLVTPRPTPAKASIPDNRLQPRLPALVTEAMRRAHGSQKAAALELHKDEGNLSRDVRERRLSLAILEDLGAPFLAELGELLSKEYGAARVHPLDRAVLLMSQLGEALMEVRR